MSYINRMQVVLAEVCTELDLNGTTWDPTDMYQPAKRFVNHLQTIMVMGDTIGVTTLEETYDDMLEFLDWEISDRLHADCIGAGLDELYYEMRGDE